MNKLAIVIPCFNEEEVLLETSKRISVLLDSLIEDKLISSDSYILFVNDGSRDHTWSLIEQLHEQNKFCCGICLSANVGHQNALLAGLSTVVNYCDMAVTIDADLQDDVNAIVQMVQKWKEDYDIVYGVRKSRATDSWFKRNSALTYYSLLQNMGVRTIYNHADFRLMSKRAIEALLQFDERNLFLRGMVPLVGYQSTEVYYDRSERFAGDSKYPFGKMVSLAVDGITSFSVKPVHFVLYLGVIFLLIAFCILIWVMWEYIQGNTVQGWTSLILSLWFCSGCVLVGLGIVGEYIGKIYIEVKHRPRFNISQILMKK